MNLTANADRKHALSAMWYSLCAAMWHSYSGTGFANPHAVTQIATGFSTSSFSYDNSGNLIQKTVDGTTTTYIWDYANRLTALGVGGATTTYGYDAFGNIFYRRESSFSQWDQFSYWMVVRYLCLLPISKGDKSFLVQVNLNLIRKKILFESLCP